MDSRSHVGHLSIRSRLPRESASEHGRLQRAWRDLSARALERALDSAGLPADETICVRRLDLHMRLWLGQTDEAMVSEWAAAVARALRLEIDAGRSDGIVRFRSTLAGVVDAVRGLVRGSMARAWAWRQLGLRIDGPAPDAVVRVLLHEATLTLPALIVLGGDAAFVAWAPRIPDGGWESIASTAVRASGRAHPEAGACTDDEIRIYAGHAPRILLRSPLRELTARVAAGRAASVRDALALLVVLAGEPSRLDGGTTAAPAMVAALARSLPEFQSRATDATPEHTAPGASSPQVPGDARLPASSTTASRDRPFPHAADAPDDRRLQNHPAPDRHQMTRADRDPSTADVQPAKTSDADMPPDDAPKSSTTSAMRESSDRRERSGAETREFRTSDTRDPRSQEPREINTNASTSGVDPEAATAGREDDFEEGPLDLRRRAWTEWGGLLFLLHIVGETAVYARAIDAPSLKGHSVGWTLHRVAMLIVPCDPRDPSALAFAGLPPDAQPPDEDEPSEEAVITLLDIVRTIRLAAAERLAADPDADDFFSLCARKAEVVADPGWFDIRFPLDSVSLRVRRAGLDLDPGYLPWLGVVVRFTYA
jgi:hypothetical protein